MLLVRTDGRPDLALSMRNCIPSTIPITNSPCLFKSLMSHLEVDIWTLDLALAFGTLKFHCLDDTGIGLRHWCPISRTIPAQRKEPAHNSEVSCSILAQNRFPSLPRPSHIPLRNPQLCALREKEERATRNREAMAMAEATGG